ncbi:hypothetical protein AB3N60_10790 [Leptospira sp. WS39.C2]
MASKFTFFYSFLWLISFLSIEIYPEKKEQIINFTEYEMKETYQFDCQEKKECFKKCSNRYVAMPWRLYDQFHSLEQFSLRQCNQNCIGIICSRSH